MRRPFSRAASLLFLGVAGAAAAAPPARLELAYEMSRNGSVVAEVVQRLEHGAGTYRLVETWKGRGLLAMRGEIQRVSLGSVGPGGLRPAEYTDTRPGRQPSVARFDWKAGVVNVQHKGRGESLPMPSAAQDRLSFLFQLAFRPPGTGPVQFSVVDGTGASAYVLEPSGAERVKTPAGEFEALRLARRPSGPDDARRTDVWLAPAHGHIVVRLAYTEKDGTRYEQALARLGAAPR